jgi:hypothetical protein
VDRIRQSQLHRPMSQMIHVRLGMNDDGMDDICVSVMEACKMLG